MNGTSATQNYIKCPSDLICRKHRVFDVEQKSSVLASPVEGDQTGPAWVAAMIVVTLDCLLQPVLLFVTDGSRFVD